MIDSFVTAVDEWREMLTGRNQNMYGGGWKEKLCKSTDEKEDKR